MVWFCFVGRTAAVPGIERLKPGQVIMNRAGFSATENKSALQNVGSGKQLSLILQVEDGKIYFSPL